MSEFSHLDNKGNVKMVDVSDMMNTLRVARAEGTISMKRETILAIQDDSLPKGNVLTTSKIAGIQAAKKTAELIPMCHQLNLSFVDIEFFFESTKEYISLSTISVPSPIDLMNKFVSSRIGVLISLNPN